MVSLFRTIKPPMDEDCGYCREPLANGEIVVEHWDQRKNLQIHPIHRNCIQQWFKNKYTSKHTCPVCRVDIHAESLSTIYLSFTEKTYDYIKRTSLKSFGSPVSVKEMALLIAQDVMDERKQIVLSYVTCAIGSILIISIGTCSSYLPAILFCNVIAVFSAMSFITSIACSSLGARTKGTIGSIVGGFIGGFIPPLCFTLLTRQFIPIVYFPGAVWSCVAALTCCVDNLAKHLNYKDWRRQQ
jgi:hypothetical protein